MRSGLLHQLQADLQAVAKKKVTARTGGSSRKKHKRNTKKTKEQSVRTVPSGPSVLSRPVSGTVAVTAVATAAAADPGSVFEHYEHFKRSHKNTELVCRDQNLKFTPMILEAHGGGWSPTFRRMVDWIARSAAAANHETPAAVSLRIAQRIACSLQRENARAVLRRHADTQGAPETSAWAEIDSSDPW